ncbi:MAG: YegS/Rv2252/BmrU family lipid kinase [Erysipelotrichaceae bacterium]|nr:YegS/Rv2252/BmrU family lipid kinase [Erysipelotrichaceae bacterium]MBQ4252265.1 YegS/Rv2252/BmrU family lipid kinase [Erysipelotrichaceae bacterium]
MRKKVLFLANFSSGIQGNKEKIYSLVNELVVRDCEVVLYPIIPNERLGSENILEETDYPYDCIICCGGDGTLNKLINSLHENGRKTTIGYFPMGSTNDFASSLYGTRNLDVAKLAEGVRQNCTYKYDIGRFNDHYFNYVAAFGAFTKVSYGTDQNFKNTFGYLAYALTAIGNIPEALNARIGLRVTSEEVQVEGNFLIGAVSNTTSIGGLEPPMINRSQLNDGLFEVTLIRTPKNILELNDLITMLVAGDIDNQLIVSFSTRKVTLEFENPTEWTLDGEAGGSHRKVVIEALPEAQEIFLPQQ